MKKINSICSFVFVISLLTVMSCSSEDDVKSGLETLTTKAWTLTRMETRSDSVNEDVTFDQFAECNKDKELTFSEDSGYVHKAGANDCAGFSDYSGAAGFMEGKKSLVLTYKGVNITFQIESLSTAMLILTGSHDAGVGIVDYRLTFRSKE